MQNLDKMPVYVPGITAEMAQELEDRITEFENLHEADVIRGGAGWVPAIKKRDFIIAIVVNAVIAANWVIAMLT
jgi:hypothetical protein